MADFIHFGHINALKKASINSNLNIFGLVSDNASDAWFGSHISNELERRTVLEGIKYIDEVWKQETFDPLDNLKKLHSKYPDAIISLFSGNEWAILSAKKYVESIGGKVVKLDYYDKLSPQTILDTLNRNEFIPKTLDNNLISTKANTLQALKNVLSKSRIEELYIATVGDFRNNQNTVLDGIFDKFSSGKVVIRSSSKREDAFEESNAGHFTSVLNVNVAVRDDVKRAIETVISSYDKNPEDDEQVLIQRQTEDVLVSGVIFTRDIQRNRPYYVINYDISGSTDSVTSGTIGTSAWISHKASREYIPKNWQSLMDAVWELEEILPNTLLDIEFAITTDTVVIFQVRPLAAAYKFGRKNNDKAVNEAKQLITEKYKDLHKFNHCTCFSDMAFWNPAEIIGDNPKNLDFSLYREIITKSAWNKGLLPMGYRSVPEDLMLRFGNKPYISVERSFDALIPSSISDSLALKLRSYYVGKLKQDLSAHDKIEFEISHNCFDFSIHKRLSELMVDSFKTEEILEIEEALKKLTYNVISSYSETLNSDLFALKQLECVRLDIQNITNNGSDFRLIAKAIHTLLNAINDFGTTQFSRHARCAFIAKSLCKSLVAEGYINSEQFNQFMSSIKTVAVEYDEDYHAVLERQMSKETFVSKYGHLRAGTYNIRSPRYDQMKENLFSGNTVAISNVKHVKHESRTVNVDNIVRIAFEKAILEADFAGISSEDIVHFIKVATEQREYFKFIFTKSLSFVIELIKNLGKIVGFSDKDLSYLELPEIYASEFYSDIDRLHEFWSLIIEERRRLYKINSELILPAVICSEQDFSYIENINSRPNFITEHKISGDVVLLDDTNESIAGKIVVCEKADPGYDWIFSRGIIGLITKYGGAASHMAIRCAEFNIPAAIGSGVALYNYVAESKRLTIDCKHEKIIRVE